MDSHVIEDTTIRAYLLGRFDSEDELSRQLDERMLADAEFSLHIDVVEDEILEDYLDGVLKPADVAAVEGHFLLPPERQHKLRRMRLISRGLAIEAARKSASSTAAQVPYRQRRSARLLAFPAVRTWMEIAAGLTLAVCALYFWNQQHELRLLVEQTRRELTQRKAPQAAGLVTSEQTTVAMLNLLEPGLSRGEQILPEAHLTPGTETLHISIALTTRPANPLSVRLQQDNALLWSHDGASPRTVAGGAVLDVDLPTAVVPEGVCHLILTGPGKGQLSYWFRVSRTR
jgi:hypothetical protein